MALADLTVTSDRARVVSFTIPFMASNIEVLYKPPSPVGDLASLVRGVFSPLSQEVRNIEASCWPRLVGRNYAIIVPNSIIIKPGRKFRKPDHINQEGSEEFNE